MGGLGFRNFQEFNDALLAKQCWRLITEPNSLWARVIKAWWLPSLPSRPPMPLGEVEVTKNLRVSSLIDSFSQQWDFEFLRPFLSMVDQRAIQETLIGDSRRKDRLVWAANRNGKYYVKSGYRWLQI
ncbi:hypothetical protein EV1_021317 [Malus domestica]